MDNIVRYMALSTLEQPSIQNGWVKPIITCLRTLATPLYHGTQSLSYAIVQFYYCCFQVADWIFCLLLHSIINMCIFYITVFSCFGDFTSPHPPVVALPYIVFHYVFSSLHHRQICCPVLFPWGPKINNLSTLYSSVNVYFHNARQPLGTGSHWAKNWDATSTSQIVYREELTLVWSLFIFTFLSVNACRNTNINALSV